MKHMEVVRDTVNHVFWLLILQGVIFIGLAILILIYPPLLTALVAAAFVVLGTLLLIAAWKLNMLWRKIPGFLRPKEF
jgi:ABC-type bacteriocin/lantibiotic exporter with double-glycine peptidase domain